MKTGNLVTGAARQSDAGQCWEEKISNGTGSIEVPKRTAVRVRSTGGTTVTIDGTLAMTMAAGEVVLFNTGDGDPANTKSTVTVAIGAAAAYVQVARETYRPKLT